MLYYTPGHGMLGMRLVLAAHIAGQCAFAQQLTADPVPVATAWSPAVSPDIPAHDRIGRSGRSEHCADKYWYEDYHSESEQHYAFGKTGHLFKTDKHTRRALSEKGSGWETVRITMDFNILKADDSQRSCYDL